MIQAWKVMFQNVLKFIIDRYQVDKETFEEDNKFDFDIQNKNKSMSHEEVERSKIIKEPNTWDIKMKQKVYIL